MLTFALRLSACCVCCGVQEEVGVETDEERKVQPNDYATLYRDMPAVKPAGKGKAKK